MAKHVLVWDVIPYLVPPPLTLSPCSASKITTLIISEETPKFLQWSRMDLHLDHENLISASAGKSDQIEAKN